MKIGIFYSLGKDSSLALYKFLNYNFKPTLLINIPNSHFDIYFQKPYENLIETHSKLLDLDYKIEYEEYKNAIVKLAKGFDYVVSGVIYSSFQNKMLNILLEDKVKDIFNPNWLTTFNEFKKFYDFFEMKAILTKISSYGLKKDLLGKEFLPGLGEGGEFESLVLDSIYFKKRIKILDYSIKKCGCCCYYIENIKFKLENKKRKKKKFRFKNVNGNVLIVGLHKNFMHFFEYSLPLIRLFKGKYIDINKFLEEKINYYKSIILSGTSFFDNYYFKKSEEIIEKLLEFDGKIIGICAGSHILAKLLGLKLKKEKRVGIYDIKIKNLNFKSWFLTHYILEEGVGEIHYSQGIVGMRYKNYLLFNYHPEYSIIALKNKELYNYIKEFLK